MFVHVEPLLVLSCHWTVGVGVPDAAAVNVAVWPAATVWLVGWVVMAGATLPVEPPVNVHDWMFCTAVRPPVPPVKPTNAVLPPTMPAMLTPLYVCVNVPLVLRSLTVSVRLLPS